MEISVEERINALEEAVSAVLVAMGGQLDISRLLDALHVQHDKYEPTQPAVAFHIRTVAKQLSDWQDLRDLRGTRPQ